MKEYHLAEQNKKTGLGGCSPLCHLSLPSAEIQSNRSEYDAESAQYQGYIDIAELTIYLVEFCINLLYLS